MAAFPRRMALDGGTHTVVALILLMCSVCSSVTQAPDKWGRSRTFRFCRLAGTPSLGLWRGRRHARLIVHPVHRVFTTRCAEARYQDRGVAAPIKPNPAGRACQVRAKSAEPPQRLPCWARPGYRRNNRGPKAPRWGRHAVVHVPVVVKQAASSWRPHVRLSAGFGM